MSHHLFLYLSAYYEVALGHYAPGDEPTLLLLWDRLGVEEKRLANDLVVRWEASRGLLG